MLLIFFLILAKEDMATKSTSMLPIIGAVAMVAVMVGIFTTFQNISDKSKPIISADKPSIL